MDSSQWTFFVVIMVYFIGVLGFSCGLVTADKHNDRPLLVTLFLGLLWPIWIIVLAGIAWQRLIETGPVRERER